MARCCAKVSEEEIKTAFFYPSDLVNTKTTIPLRVGEERWIYISTLRVSVYIHHYSPPSSGDSCILFISGYSKETRWLFVNDEASIFFDLAVERCFQPILSLVSRTTTRSTIVAS